MGKLAIGGKTAPGVREPGKFKFDTQALFGAPAFQAAGFLPPIFLFVPQSRLCAVVKHFSEMKSIRLTRVCVLRLSDERIMGAGRTTDPRPEPGRPRLNESLKAFMRFAAFVKNAVAAVGGLRQCSLSGEQLVWWIEWKV